MHSTLLDDAADGGDSGDPLWQTLRSDHSGKTVAHFSRGRQASGAEKGRVVPPNSGFGMERVGVRYLLDTERGRNSVVRAEKRVVSQFENINYG